MACKESNQTSRSNHQEWQEVLRSATKNKDISQFSNAASSIASTLGAFLWDDWDQDKRSQITHFTRVMSTDDYCPPLTTAVFVFPEKMKIAPFVK